MGTVEMIILFLLEKKDLYGYQLSTMIGALSSGKFDVSESTLYPTLYKLLKNGYISDREVPAGKRRVRCFSYGISFCDAVCDRFWTDGFQFEG